MQSYHPNTSFWNTITTLSETNLTGVNLTEVNLSEAKGLST
ncbi:MAG: pentapeptide repeat-containing protein [Symplocastrum torsivum CPER-KK1]|uniref:Pentapeptide repeat-containing protein n=1 Tax=Symplocastrum torsivum CPER-KK1 TaxID=450513 RepID=A0A951UAF6_9CYAN|nr:pentapeptide repeat-containing protein [Symplocastrum torsivum CPER-KK1]